MPSAEPLNIKLSGPAFEPTDPSWTKASPARRLDYWKHLAEFALDVKRQEIRRGIDIHGNKLKAVKPSSRPDGATGPPLIPHFGGSRTATLLAAHHTANGCTLFWRGHGRVSWARILGYHAYKHGPRSLPVRNTIGISPAGIKKLVRNARDWWELTQRKTVVAKPKPKPEPKPGPEPKASKRVVYLKKGEKPNPLSKKIQVYETRGGKPKGPPPPPPPKPAPKPKPVPPPLPPPPVVPSAPKPTPKVAPKASSPPDPKPIAPTPAKAPQSFQEQMSARVDAELKRLVGDFQAAKQRLAEAEARWNRVKNLTEVTPEEWESAKQAVRDAQAKLVPIAERGKRFEQWRKDVRTNPDLIPPFEIQERLRIYSERMGDAKVARLKALAQSSPEAEQQLAALETDRSAVKEQLARTARTNPKYGELAEALLAINAQRQRLMRQSGQMGAPVDQVAEAIQPGSTLKLKPVIDQTYTIPTQDGPIRVEAVSRPMKVQLGEGLRYLEQITSAAGLSSLEVPVGRVYQRSFCTQKGIALDELFEIKTFVHEFGHHLENHTGAGRSAQEFLAHRVGDEKPSALAQLFPDVGYGPNEFGRKDRFEAVFGDRSAYYCGKDYGVHGTEITSMGIEALYKNAAFFADKDPEYCKFILGILDGSLR